MTLGLPDAVCEKCGAWTGRARQRLCVDCKRKSKVYVKCAKPGCEKLFLKRDNRRYCVEHTAT